MEGVKGRTRMRSLAGEMLDNARCKGSDMVGTRPLSCIS